MAAKSQFFVTLTILTLTTLNLGCGKKSSSSENESSTDKTNSLALQDATVAESLDLSASAIETFDDAITAVSGSLAIEEDTSLTLSEEKAASRYCTNKGEPLAEKDESFASLIEGEEEPDSAPADDMDKMSATDDKYAARAFHCKMKVDSGSSETVRGIIALPKGIACAIAQAGKSLEEDGEFPATIAITEECFSEEFVASNESEGNSEFEANIKVTIDEESAWSKEVVISDISVMPGQKFTLKFSNTADMLGVLLIGENSETPGEQSASAFSLTPDGVLRIETKDYRLGLSENEDRWTRGLRMIARGKMKIDSADDKLSASFYDFANIEGVFGDIEDSSSRSYLDGHTATITGTADAGFLTKTHVCNEESSHPEQDCSPAEGISEFLDVNGSSGSCVPSTKKCSGLEPLEFGDDVDFLMITYDYENADNTPLEWAKNLSAPLNFETVTTDFAQLP